MAGAWDLIADPGSLVRGDAPAPAKPKGKPESDLFGGGLDPAALAAGGGMGAAGPITPQDIISALLQETALEMQPNSGFRYGQDDLPHWFPKALRPLVAEMPREVQASGYDPYTGMPGAGDERVFFGTEPDPDSGLGGADLERASRAAGFDQYGRVTEDDYKPSGETGGKRDKTVTYAAALNRPYLWDDEQVSAAMKKFRQAGINVTNFDELTSAWKSLVDRASQTYSLSGGKRKVSPWDVLEMSKREAETAGTFTDFENGTQTRTATSVSEVSEGASWQVLQQTLSTLLGRDPSDQEMRDYAYRMNTLAAKNPSVTETITRYRAGEAVSQESSTSGGFDAEDMAKAAYDEAQDDPEYARVQGATTYWNAMMQAIGAIGDI